MFQRGIRKSSALVTVLTTFHSVTQKTLKGRPGFKDIRRILKFVFASL